MAVTLLGIAVLLAGMLWAAFVRGRRSRNLYDLTTDAGVAGRPLGEVRDSLGLAGKAPRASVADGILFVLCGIAALAVTVLPLAAGIVAVVWLIRR